MVFDRCIVNWSGGLCILSICAFYMCNLRGIVFLQRCIVNWSRGYIYSQYMCIILCMKVIWFNAIPYIYFQLEWGVLVSSYMCILIYVTLIWCNGIA